ncbi:thiamine diphosphokinase [Ketogulonicigenium vulgare]|uniref:thiamine diphosphokinase n=1 Tax=Ketogulonicigenium vulgare TaxID=92945 RepID=UPI00235A458C|nr:thiamine diphosphokinase [Ketogulonicigenium vulgare]
MLIGPVPVDHLPPAQGAAIVAVDGGADQCLRHGLQPDLVIGDLDSLGDAARAAFHDRLIQVNEQITTDFEKALIHVGAPLRLAVGFWGGRADHALAVLGALAGHPDRRTIVIGTDDIIFHCPPAFHMELPAGTRVSLFPLVAMECDSTGLEWATHGLHLDPLARTGVSNSAKGGPVSIAPARTGLLVILPRASLPAAVAALG